MGGEGRRGEGVGEEGGGGREEEREEGREEKSGGRGRESICHVKYEVNYNRVDNIHRQTHDSESTQG